ncbi:MAG: hypothetical protein HOC23_10970 [Halieaceae bacterium]|nr:hypothetical protein [Halieaceae bacterium]
MSYYAQRRGKLLLAVGALIGAVLAASGMLESSQEFLPEGTIALVDGAEISTSGYLSLLEQMSKDKRSPLQSADRRQVLNRLIEEKLLIARGLELNLAYGDPRVRKTIVNAMIETAVSEVASARPADSELKRFYADNSSYFTQPVQLRVLRMVFRGADGELRARRAHLALADEPWQQVQQRLADEDILSLPTSLLPINKMRGYLGPTLTDLAANLAKGSYSDVQVDGSGYSILLLVDMQQGSPPRFDSIREQVNSEYLRRAGDDALRDYLDQLRDGADVVIDQDLLHKLDALDADGNPG